MQITQPSHTRFHTKAAPKPDHTPATIATRFLFTSTINVWIAVAVLLSRAKQYGKAQIAVLIERFSCDPIIRRVLQPVAARGRGSRRLVIATRAVLETATPKVCPT